MGLTEGFAEEITRNRRLGIQVRGPRARTIPGGRSRENLDGETQNCRK